MRILKNENLSRNKNNHVYLNINETISSECVLPKYKFINTATIFKEKFEELKNAAMRLGSAFQKVNFLRDLKDDYEVLNRSYFPNVDLGQLDATSKQIIIDEIQEDFDFAYKNGILKLPVEAKFGVYMAYRYYKKLLNKLKSVPSEKIMDTRIRISDPMKINLLARSYVKYKLNII